MLSYLVTGPGSFTLFIVLIGYLLHSIIEGLIFPGSITLCRRASEIGISKRFATELKTTINDLEALLANLQKIKESYEDQQLKQFNLSFSKKNFLTVLKNLNELQKQGLISPNQDRLLTLLVQLEESLKGIKIDTGKNVESLWDLLDKINKKKIQTNLESLQAPMNLCKELNAFLYRSYGKANCLQKAKRWMTDPLLGNLNYMRVILSNQLNGEQIWIQGHDGMRIDCMLFPSHWNPNGPTMIFCNPNVGFYELMHFQTEWLEFYLALGINVFAWNYRGYGRSQGRSDIPNFKKDGELIVHYLRNTRQVSKLGVHGLSLGGCVATHLARNCDLDFLFADRTFSTLGDATRYNFGQFAFYPFQVLGPVDTDSAGDYISSHCYKVLAADPRDDMIDDLASLKSGIAIQLFTKQSAIPYIDPALFEKKSFILNIEDLDRAVEVLKRIGGLIKNMIKAMQSQKNSEANPDNAIKAIKKQKVYKCGAESIIDYEKVAELVVDAHNVLAHLDAGGKLFSVILSSKYIRLNFIAWLLVIDIWGSDCNEYTENLDLGKVKALELMKYCIECLKNLISQNKMYTCTLMQSIIADLHILTDTLTKIHNKLEEGETSTEANESLSSFDSFKEGIDYSSAGYLIPLKNGHNGILSSIERHIYERHLARAHFIS